MLDSQKKLVQDSWVRMTIDEELFINTLYDTFFEMTPRSRLLFKRNLKLHRKNIIAMFGSVIERLNKLDLVMPDLIPTGARHKEYNVTPDDFENFRVALIKTIKHFLGHDYTSELEEAWNEVYQFISSTMCSAMRIAPDQILLDMDSFSRP